MDKLQIKKIVCTYKNNVYNSCLCYKDFKGVQKDFFYPSLSCREIEKIGLYKSEKHKKSFFIGRYVAKTAVNSLIGNNNYGDISIDNGVLNHPILVGRLLSNIQISISHCGDFAAAVAFDEHCPLGIDTELIHSDLIEVLKSSLGFDEKEILSKLHSQYGDILYTVVWTAKEALSKLLKTGLTIPFFMFDIVEMWSVDNFLFCKYKYFKQYIAVTILDHNHVITITYPEKIKLTVEDFQLT